MDWAKTTARRDEKNLCLGGLVRLILEIWRYLSPTMHITDQGQCDFNFDVGFCPARIQCPITSSVTCTGYRDMRDDHYQETMLMAGKWRSIRLTVALFFYFGNCRYAASQHDKHFASKCLKAPQGTVLLRKERLYTLFSPSVISLNRLFLLCFY